MIDVFRRPKRQIPDELMDRLSFNNAVTFLQNKTGLVAFGE